MDFFVYVLIVMMFVGAGLVIYGAFFGNKFQENSQENDEFTSLAQKLGALETSVFEADEAANILDDMTKNVFKEFDNKYQDMLFLYNLIDEKQKKLATSGHRVDVAVGAQPDGDSIVAVNNKKVGINPKFSNVLQLSAEGKSIEQIAKQLNMGKGQVALILNLGGAGDA